MSRWVASILASMAARLGGHIDVVLEGLLVEGFELFFEFAERLLEFQQVGGSFHAGKVTGARGRLSTGLSGGWLQTVGVTGCRRGFMPNAHSF
jgi:hypothetical protein